jgi:NTP pyrophosphatase (non-canonical NTP hydrolase)
MQYSRATVGQLQLDEYVAIVPKIYGTHDQNRSVWDVWCHTLHHAAAVAERIRKEAPADKLFKEIADFALWLLTAVHRLSGRPGRRKTPTETPVETLIRIGGSCSDMVWHRYPGVCHLCYAHRVKEGRRRQKGLGLLNPCDCPIQRPDRRDKNAKRLDSLDLQRFSEAARSRKPKTIDDWQRMFAAIFGANIGRLSPADIGLHLMEELGEVSDALVRMYSYTKKDFRYGEPNWRQLRLEAQIADVFSWLFALVEKLNELSAGRVGEKRTRTRAKPATAKPITLSEIIWERYGSEGLHSFCCPACRSSVCSCPLVFVPATRPKHELLKKFSRQH